MKQISNFKSLMSVKKGFTLIELLIVIAVLGILAAVILVAIDPVEQLARGRDSSRKTSVGQIGRAFQAYYTSRSSYPSGAEWTGVATTNSLVVAGEIKTIPSGQDPGPAVGCTPVAGVTVNLANFYCYKVISSATTDEFVFYTKTESRSERTKGGCDTAGTRVYFAYSSLDGRAGILCRATAAPADEPQPNVSYATLFL